MTQNKNIAMGRNKYDYLIIVFIAMLCFGNIGEALQPIRLISFLLLPYSLCKLKAKSVRQPIGNVVAFFALWYMYNLISMLWTSDISNGGKELVYYIVHFNIFFLIYLFSRQARYPLQSICIGWCLLLALTIPIALVEIIYDIHLPMSTFDSDSVIYVGGIAMSKKFASVTFGNYNGYVTVIGFALPFLILSFFTFEKVSMQIKLWGLYCLITFILATNASRGGLLVWGICTTVFMSFFKHIKTPKLVSRSFLFATIGLLVLKFDLIFQQLAYRFISGTSIASDDSRGMIYSNALECICDNYGMGVGVGGLLESMEAYSSNIGITSLHNMWLEILTQSGFLITVLFVYLLFFKPIYRLFKSKNINYKIIGIVLFVAILPLSIINSLYVNMVVLWAFIGSIYVTYLICKSDRYYVENYHNICDDNDSISYVC